MILKFCVTILLVSGFFCNGLSADESVMQKATSGERQRTPAAGKTAEKEKKTLHILFIGNSYTSVNNVPAMVQKMGKARKKEIVYGYVYPGGYSLERHARDLLHAKQSPNAGRKTIYSVAQEKTWDFVVLQDQSGTPSCQPQSTLFGAEQLKKEIGAFSPDAKWCFYMTPAHYTPKIDDEGEVFEKAEYYWSEEQDMLNNGYNAAAKKIGGSVAPVGEAFRRNYKEDYNRMIHCNDHSHFSPQGSYLAACILYCTMTGEKAKGLPDCGVKMSVKEKERLQKLADDTIAAYGTAPRDPVPIQSQIENEKFFNAAREKQAAGK